MIGELTTVLLVMNKSIVLVHILILNAQLLGLVKISMLSLKKSLLWMPMVMEVSINTITSNMITSNYLLILVIKTVMKSLPNVKSTIVLLLWKMLTELKTVQVTVWLTVKTHSSVSNVKMLGIVK
jgi:hypothetical protein